MGQICIVCGRQVKHVTFVSCCLVSLSMKVAAFRPNPAYRMALFTYEGNEHESVVSSLLARKTMNLDV